MRAPELEFLKSISKEELEEVSPRGGFRVDFLTPLKDAMLKSVKLSNKYPKIRGIVGLISPTGAGKTDFLVSLAIKSALMGRNVTILTSGKANRIELMLRIMESYARMLKKGVKLKPKVIVVFSKIDTCISNDPSITEVLAEINNTESSDEKNKLETLFYARCNRMQRTGKCPFYKAVIEKGEDVAETIVRQGEIYVVGRITDKMREQMKTSAPTAYSMLTQANLPEGVVDIVTTAHTFGVCPYTLIDKIIKKLEERKENYILVIDSMYVLLRNNEKIEFISKAFQKDRVLLIDEAHEVPFNKMAMITYDENSDTPNILAKLDESLAEEIRRIVIDAINEWIPINNKFGGETYYATTPNSRLPQEYLARLRRLVRQAEKLLEKKKLPKNLRLRIEAEIRTIESVINSEILPGRVSSRDIHPGCTVFVKVERENGRPKYCIVPVLLTPRLKKGRDFFISILASATLSPLHLRLVHKVRTDYAEKVLATVEWPPAKKNRFNLYIDTRTYMEERPIVAETIKKILMRAEKYGLRTVEIVATSTWRDYIEAVANTLGYKYIPILSKKSIDEITGIVTAIKNMIRQNEKVVIHITPYTSMARSIDLAPIDVETNTLVIVPSEAVQPTTEESIAEMVLLERKYEFRTYMAWDVVHVVKAVHKVIQTIGRVQRSSKHRTIVIFMGRLFKRHLEQYVKLYGEVNKLYSDVEPDPDKIAEIIDENIAKWV